MICATLGSDLRTDERDEMAFAVASRADCLAAAVYWGDVSGMFLCTSGWDAGSSLHRDVVFAVLHFGPSRLILFDHHIPER